MKYADWASSGSDKDLWLGLGLGLGLIVRRMDNLQL